MEVLSAFGLFITSLFKKSLDARQKMAYLINSKLPSRHFFLTAIGHGGYLTFCLAGCGRLFGANFDLVGDFQRSLLSASSELAIAIFLISMGYMQNLLFHWLHACGIIARIISASGTAVF